MSIVDLLDRLPSPVAFPLQSYLEESHPHLKLWAICDSVELLLRLLVFVGIADLAGQDGKPPQALRAKLREPIERPTFGGWWGMAEAVTEALERQPDSLVPELAPWVRNTLAPLLKSGGHHAENSLLALRNRLAHGGGVTRALAEKLLAVWREPFEQAMQTIAWLGELTLVVPGLHGYSCLRGPTPEGVPYTPGNLATVAEALARADAVAVVRGDRALPLWPLLLYGPPGNPYDDHPSGESVPQVYVRQGDIRLQYTPLGAEVCHSEAGDAALARFQELFHMDRAPSPTRQARFQVRDFRDRIRSLADRLVGRTVELATLRGVLEATAEGVIWVAGTAGIGKSSLLARIAQDYLEAPPSHMWVLPYWFDAGDARCQREMFLRFAIERLRDWLCVAPPDAGQDPPKPLIQLRTLLQQGHGQRVVFILDGLDEITSRDRHFARDIPLSLRLPGVVWLCAGRPEQGLSEQFNPEIAHHPFPNGLPPMREGDIREMLLNNLTGELCKRLIGHDQERGEQVKNPFIDKVAKAAHGLPLYVRYVINDIWAGRYRLLDAGERLPPSLNAYHEEHLRRCSVSSLHQVLTPIVALLAVMYEEPTVDILAALLRQRTLIPAGERGLALVQEGLNALESMIKRKRDEDGQIYYALHHHSLRQHIQNSPPTRQAVETAREFLGDAALQVKPDAAAHYLYRYGIDHLVEEEMGRHQDALRLLTRFDYLMARFHILQDTPVAADLRIDWQTYLETGGVLDDEARIWQAFFRENEHILRRGDEDWPAYKILLQLAIEHADDSPITQQAEAWLAQPGNCDWVWLRNPCRPEHVPFNPVVQIFEGHADTVNGALELSDGRILSWSEDCTLRIWDRDDSSRFIELKGHTRAVTGAKELPDNRIISCSKDGTLRFWDSTTGYLLEELYLNENELSGVDILPNGKIIFYTNKYLLKLIDIDGKIISLNKSSEHIHNFNVLPDNTIVSWNYQQYYCWNGETGEQVSRDENMLKNIRENKEITSKFDDNVLEILSSLAEDFCYHSSLEKIYTLSDQYKILELGFGALWLLDYRNMNVVLRQVYNEKISGIEILSKNDILIWEDKYVRILHISSNLPLVEYQEIGKYISQDDDKRTATNVKRHFAEEQNVKLLENNRVLSWDYATMGIWDSDTGKNISVYLFNPTSDDVLSILDVEVLNNRLFLLQSGGGYYLFNDNSFYEIMATNFIQLPDQNFACIYFNNQIAIRCGRSGKIINQLKGHLKRINDIKLLPNEQILSWSEDCTLRLWDFTTGECIKVMQGHIDTINGVHIVSNERIVSWSEDRTLRLWDSTTGECIRVMRGHKSAITGVHLSDEYIFSWSGSEDIWCLWDVITGQFTNSINVMDKHIDIIIKTYLLPNEFILSISKDGVLCLWSIKSCDFIENIVVKGNDIHNVIELTNGNFLVSIKNLECYESLSNTELCIISKTEKRFTATIPSYYDQKIETLDDGNFILWSNYRSSFSSKIVNGFTGKIISTLADKENYIEKIYIEDNNILVLINNEHFWTVKFFYCDENYIENEEKRILVYKDDYYICNELFYSLFGVKMINHESNDRAVKIVEFSIYWHADCVIKYNIMSDDGTYIVSTADGRIVCLKLYRGASRITIDELADDYDQS